MSKQTAVPTTSHSVKASPVAAKGRQQDAFYDVLTQLTLQQMRNRASQRG